jgi:hypothetical protein
MFSISTLLAINSEIAAEAARRDSRPLVPFDQKDVDRWPPFPFPSLGDFEPLGWENTGTSWFVDSTGHGSAWESAMTVDAFKAELLRYVVENPGHGFAITEEGEFQVVVSAFRRVALIV